MTTGGLHFSPRPNRAHEIRWRPWGAEAFQEAAAAGKPVLLGISAVWCHWCHVMDETSYSDPEVIRVLNERYVTIRVDNDERPDVNRRYNMGGWPTTVFLTPDGEIIHGATYVPPDQMRQVVVQVADVWAEKSSEIAGRVAEMIAKESAARVPHQGELTGETIDTIDRHVRGQYDPQFGGFGREPKFPQPHVLRFLIERYASRPEPEVADMIHKTFAAMAGGGMYDHVEGGFFRYSTTRQWTVPHFEKMLEDNAQLLALYADAHRLFPSAGYERVVRDVIRYLDTVLWRPDVAAFSGSQDADEHYFTLDAHRRGLHGAPFVDTRVYTSWNALAASGYLAAGRALGDASLSVRAAAVLGALLTRMRGADGALHRYDRGDGPELPDLLGDYATTIAALLDAHEMDALPGALDEAVALATRMRDRLGDGEAGGFFDRPDGREPGRLGRREKPIEDGAAAADALLRLAALTGDGAWRESALRTLRGFAHEYTHWGQLAAAYATTVARALEPEVTVVVVAPAGDALWMAARDALPAPAARQRLDPVRDRARLDALGYPADRVAAYACVGSACSAPLTTPAALAAELRHALAR